MSTFSIKPIYPISIQRRTLSFEQGRSSKEYHIIYIETAGGRALVINRWGRKGSWGQMQVFAFSKLTEAASYAAEKEREKIGKGYSVSAVPPVQVCADEYDFRMRLGPQYIANLNPDNLRFLLGEDVDTTGVRERENPEFEQTPDGRWVRKEKPLNTIKDPEPTVEEQVSRNPLWGLF